MAAYFPNRYSGKCSRCSTKVVAGAGICQRDPASHGWIIGCHTCFPVEVNHAYAPALKAQADREALEASRKQRIAEQAAARQALIEKLGIDLKDVRNSVCTQHAWSDSHTWEVPYQNEGTFEEFAQAVRTPSESLYGNLRASQGIRLVGIDYERKVLKLSESIPLCD